MGKNLWNIIFRDWFCRITSQLNFHIINSLFIISTIIKIGETMVKIVLTIMTALGIRS